MLTPERLREVLHYDPETGVFVWVVDRRRTRAGDRAGCLNKTSGYVVIGVDGRLYQAHRLAWLYMTDHWPSGHLDHEDRNRANNTWSNLRPASKEQNGANQNVRSNNTSGFKGVSLHKRSGKWQASIRSGAASGRYLGLHPTADAAARAYNQAAIDLHGEFACLNEVAA